MNKNSIILMTMVGVYGVLVVPGILILGHVLRTREKQLKLELANSLKNEEVEKLKLIWYFGDGEGTYGSHDREKVLAFRNHLVAENPETSYSEIAWRIE